MMIDVDEVKTFTGINPQHLKLDSDDEGKLKTILEEWISQSEDLIKSYTHNEFPEDNLPGAVKNVCLRLTANMVALAIERRDTPRTKVTEWNIKVSSSDIFTNDLKEDLAPFIKDFSNTSDKIDFFTITGGDDI
ncbi:MAG: hypothetical protein IKF11_00595 [Methanobrevibacter sp.]|nr:hypothetical protein [Methanobrevibacter sp.]